MKKKIIIGLLGSMLALPLVSNYAKPTTVQASTVQAYKASGKVTTNSTSLNMRKSASTNAAVIAAIPKGKIIAITGKIGNWYRVSYNNKVGFVSKTYVTIYTAPKPAPVSSVQSYSATGTVTTKSTSLNMRKSASANAAVVATIPKGTKISITGKIGSWYRVSYNKKIGFVSKAYVTIYTAPKPAPKPVVGPVTNYSNFGYMKKKSSYFKTQSNKSGVVGSLNKDALVKITGTSGSWYRINVNNKIGYVLKSEVSWNPTYQKYSNTATLKKNGKVYVATNTTSKTFKDYGKGKKLKITGKTKSWYRVSVGSASGYILASKVDLHPSFKTAKTVKNFAYVKKNKVAYKQPSKEGGYVKVAEDIIIFDKALSTDGKWVRVTNMNNGITKGKGDYYFLKSDIVFKKYTGTNKTVKQRNSIGINKDKYVYLDSLHTSVYRKSLEREIVAVYLGKAVDKITEKQYDKATKEISKMDYNTLKKVIKKKGHTPNLLAWAWSNVISAVKNPIEYVDEFKVYPQALLYVRIIHADKGKGIIVDISKSSALAVKSQ